MYESNERSYLCIFVHSTGNFFEDDIPSADLYLLGHVLHGFDLKGIDKLLQKVYCKLPPGDFIQQLFFLCPLIHLYGFNFIMILGHNAIVSSFVSR